MARAQATAQQFNLAIAGTLAEVRKAHAAFARRAHATVMAAAPRPSGFVRYVDGAKGAPEDAVKPNGVIVYDYLRIPEVARVAMELLFERSPVLSGLYRKSHTLFLNGAAVPNLAGWRPGDQVAISNPAPYARKIEVGSMKMRVPGHVYELVAQTLKQRFGNIANIGFTYRGLAGGPGSAPGAGGGAGNKPALRYPTITISELR